MTNNMDTLLIRGLAMRNKINSMSDDNDNWTTVIYQTPLIKRVESPKISANHSQFRIRCLKISGKLDHGF